ncbi:MAG: hypothetical protein ABIS01_02630 [Ferruginibacter sp.]
MKGRAEIFEYYYFYRFNGDCLRYIGAQLLDEIASTEKSIRDLVKNMKEMDAAMQKNTNGGFFGEDPEGIPGH